MQTRGSSSGQRPQRSPVKTRAVTNRKAPLYHSASRRTYHGEGPLEELRTVPEDRPLKPEPAWWEGILIWCITVSVVLYLTCGLSNAQIFGKTSLPVTIPTPPSSVPFTLMGLLRKAFSANDY